MLIFKQANKLQEHLSSLTQSIGFVPTMGALHEGHISLIHLSKESCDLTVASIFVNPTQFNNPDDLNKYPRTLEKDIDLLTLSNCDILYLPEVIDIYPDGFKLQKNYELGNASKVLEGPFRPGHFEGVAQVVDRFLEIIKPNKIFLGQKDLQQIAIIENMATQFHPNTRIEIGPTLRADDGLALSSRNMRLNLAQRAIAPSIYQTLISIQAKKNITNFQQLQKESIDFLNKKGFEVEYLALFDRNNWEESSEFEDSKQMAILVAAYLGDVRLIDNILL